MKVLFLTQTSELGPSSRYRVFQLVPLLEKMGIECEVSAAIDDELYRAIYLEGSAPRRNAAPTIWRKRRADLQRIGEFDAVFIQKGVFPGLYSGFERKIAARKPLVFDFDDAIWLPRQGGSAIARLLHRERTVQALLHCARAVIAGNNFLADYASRFNKNVTVVPSSIDLSRYSNTAALQHSTSPVVGWIGSSTTSPYLRALKPVAQKLGLNLRVIASGSPAKIGFPVEFRPWRLETEVEELAQLSIGLAPLPDTPWERGKCGVKILQYMACGIPVVASPVGVQAEMVVHGVNGFLAEHEVEWVAYLRQLMDDAKLREQMGAAGRDAVRKLYSAQRAAEAVAGLLRKL
jgi:glycosyltransferase involved in cell wall biosynthesis